MPHVLLVDDDPVQSAVYARLLQASGFTTDVAPSAREALATLGAKVPDALLVDLGLPDTQSVELIRTVRDLPQGRGVKVYVLANAFLELEALAAWEAGADQVIGKSNHTPEQVREILVAEFGDLTPEVPASTGPDPALDEFLTRAADCVRASREALAGEGGPADPSAALRLTAECLHRLQAAQAFGIPEIPQLAAVAEWLTRALLAWPSSLGASAVRTLRQALDAIERRIAAPAAPVRQLQACRALGVDDDGTSRILLQQAFRRVRLPCDLAADGKSALALASATRYDLVVSDVMMPGMDGFELIARLRERPEYAATPVIYVTALDGFDGAFARDAHGGTDAIVKPYLIMELATKAIVHLCAERPAG